MSVLSKLVSEENWTSLRDVITMCISHVSCYEVAHVWQPSCTLNAYQFTRDVFLICCALYTPLFVGTQMILPRKFNQQSMITASTSVLRSSAFIANHVWMFYLLICGSKKVFGYWYFAQVFPMIFAISYISMYVEKKSRRGPLALYVTNIGTECLMNILHDKGYLPKIPHASVIIFTLSLSILLRQIKREGYGSDPISFALRLVIGTAEAKKRVPRNRLIAPPSQDDDNNNNNINTNGMSNSNGNSNGNSNSNSNNELSCTNQMTPEERVRHARRASRYDVKFNQLIPEAIRPALFNDSKHECCRHRESCSEYVTGGFIRPFAAAWAVSSVLSVAKKAMKIPSDPSVILTSLTDSRNLRFGLFIGSFAGVYRAVNCYLRWRYNESADWHASVAGAIAGPTMLLCPTSTIAQSFFWKVVENFFIKATRAGYISNPHAVIKCTYSAAVSIIAYCVMLQPKYMRPSYMRFADIVSGHKFHLINRCFVQFIVPDAVQGYEKYFADLHPDLCTSKFNETVLTWLLEAKDYARRDYA